jgi:ATP-dependent Clp protease adaptor protein ClpS
MKQEIVMSADLDTDITVEPVVEDESKEARVRDLVLYNDDVNTFDYVIECLVEVCKHDLLQAEQCTYIVHYTGKCSVKSGSYNQLNPMREALCERGLSAVIE